jgi:hypothetical protein
VNGLEQQLAALGNELALPAEPDLAPAVLQRLEGRRPFPWRSVALVFAVVAIAVGAAFAVPQARTAILRFFHLGGATVERVDTLPRAVERSRAGGLGRPLSLARAQQAVGYRLALPPVRGGAPKRVYVVGDSLATVLLRVHGRPVLLSEFSSFGPGSLKKLTIDTKIEDVSVNGAEGLWLSGGPHVLRYFDRNLGAQELPVLVHGNVLLWLRGPLTLRLEGKLTKAQALDLARSVR